MTVRLTRALPWFLAGTALLAVISSLIWLPKVMDEYPLQQVQVRGVNDERRQQEVEMALSGLLAGENFFSVPLAALHREVTALSWVADARVRRHWPDRLVMQVRERIPVAVWNGEVLVSGSGEPFLGLSRYNVDGLPRLSGPAPRLDDVMVYYHSMGRVLSGIGLAINSLEVDSRLTARVRLNNGTLLVVDREHYANKLRRFVRLYETLAANDGRYPERVDLRYADGMAVTWSDTVRDNDERV
jgi:cell division protein FtsQ